jgi:predicted phage-related endonuclease
VIRTFDVIDCEQGTDAWRTARLGRLTGSSADAVLAEGRKKGEPSVTRAKLIRRLVTERLTLQAQESSFSSVHMERGTEVEPLARGAYEAASGNLIRTTGFLSNRALMAGCSLDGHVGDFEGIVEIKCPMSTTHADYLRVGGVPADYVRQMTHNLWISGAAWCDFVSFDDRFIDPRHHLFVVRYEPTAAALAEYDQKARAFLAEVDAEYRAFLGWKVVA